MEIDVRKRRNQRNKRRERAQRMQAERDRDSVDSAGSTTNVSNSGSGASRETGNGTSTPQNTPATITNTSAVHADSADEDMANAPPIREKPPPRRKKQKEQSPLLEEDIIDGFAILAFKTYEDLEVSSCHPFFLLLLFPIFVCSAVQFSALRTIRFANRM